MKDKSINFYQGGISPFDNDTPYIENYYVVPLEEVFDRGLYLPNLRERMYASYTFDKHYQDFIDIVEWAMAKMAKPLPKRPQPKKPNRKPRKTR